MFPGTIFDKFYRKLARQSGVPDLPFGRAERLDNSALSLEAAEFAKGQDAFDRFHDHLFRAHFVEERNISRLQTILEIAAASGIDPAGLEKALAEKQHASRIRALRDSALLQGISGVPTFILNTTHRLVGAQPREGFRNLLMQLDHETELLKQKGRET